MFFNISVLKNFAKFEKTHPTQILFFSKALDPYHAILIKNETPAQVFSCKFREMFKNIFFTEHIRVAASVCW